MHEQANRREFTRVPVTLPGEIVHGQTAPIEGKCRDVSLKGTYFICDHPSPIGTVCRVILLLGEAEDQTHIEAHGKVVRVDETGMGIEFTEILGPTSYDHLRNLVLYNSSTETQKVEREFQQHIGLNRRE